MSKQILTDEQVENWRRVLCGMIGPYALLMSREQIQLYRDRMQAQVSTGQSLAMDEHGTVSARTEKEQG